MQILLREELKERLVYNLNTRFHGYENVSPQEFYNSVLSCGKPIVWIDKITFRVPISRLPIAQNVESTCFHSLKEKHGYQYGIRKEFQFRNCFIKLGWTNKVLMLYIEIYYLDPFRTLLSQLIDVLEHLLNVKIILHKGNNPRRSSYRFVSLFSIIEIETRFDCGTKHFYNNIKSFAKKYAVSSVKEEKRFSVNLTSWDKRYDRNSHIKVYGKGEKFIRLEVILYRKLLQELNKNLGITLNRRPSLLIPDLLEIHYGCFLRLQRVKPDLGRNLINLIHQSRILIERCRELELSDLLVRSMTIEGQMQNIF